MCLPIVNNQTLYYSETLENMMKTALILSFIGLTCTLTTVPVSAQVTGPRGGTASGNGAIVPNRQGGYSGYGQGNVTGPQGGTANGQVRFQTNGQQGGSYSGSGTATNTNGQTVNANTNGSGSYNSTTGYIGQNTTTVNGNTYNATTQTGTTTVTSPDGVTRTYTYGSRRR